MNEVRLNSVYFEVVISRGSQWCYNTMFTFKPRMDFKKYT
jgi:hypothetical protein